MANTHSTLASLFTDIAGAIRSKTGGTGAIVADQFPEAIAGISVGVDTSDATASTGEILSGETAYVNGAKVTGTMANNGAVSQAINAGGSYTIPAGYHNGSGKVTGNSLANQTSANAAAGDIASGKTAWVNGSKVTGTLVQNAVKIKAKYNDTLCNPLTWKYGASKLVAIGTWTFSGATVDTNDIIIVPSRHLAMRYLSIEKGIFMSCLMPSDEYEVYIDKGANYDAYLIKV